MPQVNAAGLDLIKSFEGCRLLAYDDARPAYVLQPGDTVIGTLTIGWGHTGPSISIGTEIPQNEADELLVSDLSRFEMDVNNLVSRDATPNQFAALVSFAYNLGAGALADSTLLRMFNAGDIAGAADEFGNWVHAGGEVLEGLVRRRAAERALFLTP